MRIKYTRNRFFAIRIFQKTEINGVFAQHLIVLELVFVKHLHLERFVKKCVFKLEGVCLIEAYVFAAGLKKFLSVSCWQVHLDTLKKRLLTFSHIFFP